MDSRRRGGRGLGALRRVLSLSGILPPSARLPGFRFAFAAPGVGARAVALALGGWLLVAASPAAAQTAPDFGSATQTDLSYSRHTIFSVSTTLPEASGATSYSLNPASPFGLDFDADTRTLSGIATTAVGVEEVTYTATNSAGSDDLIFSITVIGPDFTTTQPDLTFDVDETVNVTLPEADGATRHTLVTTRTPLPPGIIFTSSTRVLSGAPTTAGDYPLSYQAVAEFSSNDFLVFNIVVEAGTTPPVSFGAETIADQTYAANTAITELAFPIASGGGGALTYTLTGPPGGQLLPPGLVFAANGGSAASPPTLTGTPDGGADAPFTYTASAGSASASLTFRLVISGTPHFGDQTAPPQTYVLNVSIDLLNLPIFEHPGSNITGISNVVDLSDSSSHTAASLGFGVATSVEAVAITGTPNRAGDYQFTHVLGSTASGFITVAQLRFPFTVLATAPPAPDFGSATVEEQTYTQDHPIPPPDPAHRQRRHRLRAESVR